MKTLAKYHDACFAVIAGGAIQIDHSVLSSGWQLIDASGAIGSETYFDLAGLSQEEKTLFFEGMAVQESGVPAIAGQAGDNYILYDIMTSVPFDMFDVPLVGSLSIRGIGFPGSELNFEHVLYARTRRLTLDLDTTARMAMVVNDYQSGSMMPTASDRIYCYRIVVVDASTMASASSINIQPARYLLNVQAKEEPTYEHIMRLKRSYDLQQSHDED